MDLLDRSIARNLPKGAKVNKELQMYLEFKRSLILMGRLSPVYAQLSTALIIYICLFTVTNLFAFICMQAENRRTHRHPHHQWLLPYNHPRFAHSSCLLFTNQIMTMNNHRKSFLFKDILLLHYLIFIISTIVPAFDYRNTYNKIK